MSLLSEKVDYPELLKNITFGVPTLCIAPGDAFGEPVVTETIFYLIQRLYLFPKCQHLSTVGLNSALKDRVG